MIRLQIPNLHRCHSPANLNTPDRDRFFRNVTNCVNHTTGYENIFEVLGRGSYGTVIKAVYQGKAVAAKVVKNNSKEMENSLINESNVLNWNHPNIINIFKIVYGPGCGVIIMERHGGDDLQQVLNEQFIPYCHKILILCDIINGLHYCHKNQVVHLDIKPQNILIEFYSQLAASPYKNYNCKLCDFGASMKISLSTPLFSNTIARGGTPRYMAPELFKCWPIKDARCDIYSLGITMWQLKTHKIPYSHFKSNQTVIYQVIKHNYRPNDKRVQDLTDMDVKVKRSGQSLLFQNFVHKRNQRTLKKSYWKIYEQCWHTNISRRPTASELWVKFHFLRDSLFI